MEQVTEIEGTLQFGEDWCRIGETKPVRRRAVWKCGHSGTWEIGAWEKDRAKIESRDCQACQVKASDLARVNAVNPVAAFQRAELEKRAAANNVTPAVQELREYFERWGSE
jgi:hypothetical protein